MRGRPRGRPPTKKRGCYLEAAGVAREARNALDRSYEPSGQLDLLSGLKTVLEITRGRKDAWLFANPVNEVVCPGYFSIVKEPMDLSLIAKRVEDAIYTSKEAFVKDFKRMVENCAFYNGLQSEVAGKGYRLWMAMLDTLHTVLGSDDASGSARLPGSIGASKTKMPTSKQTTEQDSNNQSDLDEQYASKNIRVQKRRSVSIQRQRRRKRTMRMQGKDDTSDSDDLYVPRFVRSSTSEPLKRHLRSSRGKACQGSDTSDLDPVSANVPVAQTQSEPIQSKGTHQESDISNLHRLYVPASILITQTQSKPIQRQPKGTRQNSYTSNLDQLYVPIAETQPSQRRSKREEAHVPKEQNETAVKRKRGRPPKSVSRSILKPRPPKDPAMEALSSATRKALEDSADLTYDICRLDGSLETSSDVVGYFPDLKIGGTQSHPSELISKLHDAQGRSEGYTIAEGTLTANNSSRAETCHQLEDETDVLGHGTNVQPDVENAAQTTEAEDEEHKTNQIGEPIVSTDCGTDDKKDGTDSTTDRHSESDETGRRPETEIAPDSPEIAAVPDAKGGDDAVGCDGGEEGHSMQMSSRLDQFAELATKTDGDQIEDRFGALDAIPVRCKSVPPLKYAGRTLGQLVDSAPFVSGLRERENSKVRPEYRDDESAVSEVTNKEASCGQKQPNLIFVHRPEQIPDVLLDPPDMRATEPEPKDSVESPEPSDRNVLPNDARALSEGKEEGLPKSPKLPADLQSLENECLYCVDSPKSSFSFSSGYLSEDAALSPTRYHGNSPLPQLSPSRLSPLLPTGATSLQRMCELVAEIPAPPTVPGRLPPVAATCGRRDRPVLKPDPEPRPHPNCRSVQPTVQVAVPRPIPPHDARSFFVPSANPVPSLTTTFPASTAFSNGAPVFYSLSPTPWNDAMSRIQWSYPSLVCQQGGAASRAYYVPQAPPNVLLDAPWLRRPWQQAVFPGFQNGPTGFQPVGASPAPNQVWVGAPSYGHEYHPQQALSSQPFRLQCAEQQRSNFLMVTASKQGRFP
ncbi:unnamed protein product, partial [Ixodes pacificus]